MSSFNNNVPTKFPKLKPRGPGGEALLAAERAKTNFDVEALSKFMYTEKWLSTMEKVLEVIENEPAFDKTNRYYLSRHEKVITSLQKEKRIVDLARLVVVVMA
jgi:acyl-CoA oxidase